MREYTIAVLIEASVVGIFVMLLATIISYIYARLQRKDIGFLKNPAMYITLFITGFLLHIILDISGINRWYCKICAGCR